MKFKYFLGVLLLTITLMILVCGGKSDSSATKEEDRIQGVWYSTKKDMNSNVISSINALEITDQNSAHLTSWELKGNTFASSNGPYTIILWQSTDMNLSIERSGNKISFTVPEIKEMGTVLECTYDRNQQELKQKDNENVFSQKEIPVQKIKEENIKAYQEFVAKQGIDAKIEKDMTSSEYMEHVKKNTFGN